MVPEPDAAAAARVDELELYRRMLLIRRFEEHIDELYRAAKMPGLGHLYIGEGAVAVGVCTALRDQDWITSTHRGHGHCMARGASVDLMFAELPGKRPRTTTAWGLDAHRRPGAEQPGGKRHRRR